MSNYIYLYIYLSNFIYPYIYLYSQHVLDSWCFVYSSCRPIYWNLMIFCRRYRQFYSSSISIHLFLFPRWRVPTDLLCIYLSVNVPVRDKDRYRPTILRNSEKLLDRDDILSISYSVRRAGYLAYKSLTPGSPGQEYRVHWKTGSTYRISSLPSTFAELRTVAGLYLSMSLVPVWCL